MLGGVLQGREQQWVATKDGTTNTWRILNTWHESLKSMGPEEDIPDDSPAVIIVTEGAFISLFREAARLGIIENASFEDNSEEYGIELEAKDEIIAGLKAELSTKQTIIETKPPFSEARLFKLEIANKMMKLAGLDNVSDIALD